MVPKQEEADVLEVMDRVLSAALREVRNARARQGVAPPIAQPHATDSLRKSQTVLCLDILTEAVRPMHITALLAALESRAVKTTRESLVSAISKKLAPSGPFVRTARNTFGVAGRDAAQES